MIFPPPNITGQLHVGHALTATIQDVVKRWKRMNGFQVLWIPGYDHAGIATQNVIEKNLKTKGKSLHIHINKEEFQSKAMEWKKEYQEAIKTQLKLLGASLDWKKEYFTLDPSYSNFVKTSFVRLYNDGHIFRDFRIVYWCNYLQNVVSDIEINHLQVDGSTTIQLPSGKQTEVGTMYRICYRIVHPELVNHPVTELMVDTTRPETIPGDVALAVHPNDSRYQNLVGLYAINPITGNKIPIIYDSELVNMEKGTGVVKVTPAHDLNDFYCAKRNGLPINNMYDLKGNILPHYSKGLTTTNVFDVKVEIIQILKNIKQLKEVYSVETTVPLCSRTGDLLENVCLPQWFLNSKALIKPVIDQIKTSSITFNNEKSMKNFNRWIELLDDWCISRQIWWGHSIPMYEVKLKKETKEIVEWVVGLTEEEASQKVIEKHQVLPTDIIEIKKDNDVLDTWFSSSLVPCYVSKALNVKYPLDLIETGEDIVFFWVIRMMMLCTYLTGTLPFNHIVLHPMIKDSIGRKMSKSLGNVINPTDVIKGATANSLQDAIHQNTNISVSEKKTALRNIKKQFPNGIDECGSDALRFSLCCFMHQNLGINLDVSVIYTHRKFCNKIWNLFKFMLLETSDLKDLKYKEAFLTFPDKYILSRLKFCIDEVSCGLSLVELSKCTTALHKFIWLELCDVYVEYIKSSSVKEKSQSGKVLCVCIKEILKLLHPFMPFITEELWQHFPFLSKEESTSILINPFPTSIQYSRDLTIESQMECSNKLISFVRNILLTTKHSLSSKLSVSCFPIVQKPEDLKEMKDFLLQNRNIECFKVLSSNHNSISWPTSDCFPNGLAKMTTSCGNYSFWVYSNTFSLDWLQMLKQYQTKKNKALEKLSKIEKVHFSKSIPEEIYQTTQILKANILSEIQNLDLMINSIVLSKNDF